jgi:hypothetical protein
LTIEWRKPAILVTQQHASAPHLQSFGIFLPFRVISAIRGHLLDLWTQPALRSPGQGFAARSIPGNSAQSTPLSIIHHHGARRQVDPEVLLSDNDCMKVTVELSDSELKEICQLTGERKKGPAIRKLVVSALMMKRREEIAGKFISGKWGVQLEGFEAARAADRKVAKQRGARWRK